ncbi:hypothetical protein KOR34_35740 [Posidoniimonas corsicana]|uniref:Uncharacterized protein n=1 Tax=Posidoniimonas corsicana TaxID=1938618 RepID=A0A5C5V605_9BACT|nr:hypothetical protein [Posidoniimonas corsicana]TWT33741.1 hypothetical protein KOR34_35740 [Posidoniimonas corsicana]
MHTFWGGLMIAIGLLMSWWAAARSDFVVYRLLVARSRLLWGDRVHAFHFVAGLLVALCGLLMVLGVFG